MGKREDMLRKLVCRRICACKSLTLHRMNTERDEMRCVRGRRQHEQVTGGRERAARWSGGQRSHRVLCVLLLKERCDLCVCE